MFWVCLLLFLLLLLLCLFFFFFLFLIFFAGSIRACIGVGQVPFFFFILLSFYLHLSKMVFNSFIYLYI